jgi:hypothetical protein
MMAVQRTPEGLVEGVIKRCLKTAAPATIGGATAGQPITLLNSDYRQSSTYLTNRLGPALGKEVTSEQSAFLPDRVIGDNVMFLRQMPHLMVRQGR